MTDLTRPIIGIENRTAQEVFGIMCDRFRSFSTITPAEVGGLVDAQTEARAIQRYIAPSAGRGAIVQLLKHCDGEWIRYRDHTAALAAKDAELVEVHQRYVDANEARIDAEARLAEALKALEHEQWSVIDRAIERYTNGEISDLHALGLITAGFLKLDAERVAARRVREGGKS